MTKFPEGDSDRGEVEKESAPPTRGVSRRSRFAAITDFLFGYDVFISYSRRDASDYARSLQQALEARDYRCFIDKRELPVGSPLDSSLLRALSRSSALVVVGSPVSLGAKSYVPKEIRGFAQVKPESRRKIVPISIGDTLDTAGPECELRKALSEVGNPTWETEPAWDALAQPPSERVRKALLDSFDFTRRNTWRLRAISVTGVVLAVLLLAAIYAGILAMQQRNFAQSQEFKAINQTLKTTLELVTRFWNDGDVPQAVAGLSRALPSHDRSKIIQERRRRSERRMSCSDESST
jgi:hypothetical protein